MRQLGWKMSSVLLLVSGLALTGLYHLRPRVPSREYAIGWQDAPPFQQKAENGSPAGLAVDLVNDAARRRGIRLRWVWTPGSSETALKKGDVDLWPLITITPQREREKAIHISKPYLQHDHSLLVLARSPYRNLADLASASISYPSMPINEQFLHQVLPGAHINAAGSNREVIEDMCTGNTEAAFLDEFTAGAVLLSGLPCSQALHVIALPALRSKLGVGSTLAASAVADEIRRGIDSSVLEGDLARILANGGYYSPRNMEYFSTLVTAQRHERWLLGTIAVFAILLGLALFEADRIRRQRNRIRAAERALRDGEERLRLIANNLTEMVWMYDMNRRLVFANHAVEGLTGYVPPDLRDECFTRWAHPDDLTRLAACWDKLFEGVAYGDQEYRLITKSGGTRWVLATWHPIHDETGRQCGVLGSERDVTEKKLAGEALRESEWRFHELLERVQLIALMTDLEGRITFCNEYALAVTGWTRDEVIGTHAQRLLDASLPFTTPDVFEGSILEKSGGRRCVEWSCVPLHDASGRLAGFASLGQDVTELRALRLQAAERESEQRFQTLADTAPLMIWAAGPDQGCTFVNKGWLAFTGRTAEQEMGNGWTAAVHPDDLDSCLAAFRASFEARREIQIEYRKRRADGEYRWVLGHGIARYGLNGGFEGYIGTCTDITDLQRSRDEKMARQKLETFGRLAGGIAHDFNNILGGILAQADLAADVLKDGESPREHLNFIRGLAVRASTIVRQLMIYAGQEDSAAEPIDISSLVDEMRELLRVIVDKQIDLRTDLQTGLLKVRANPAQLRQLVVNLVTNSAEAIGGCKGVISISTRNIDGAIRNASGSWIEFTVSDTGGGIAPEVQSRIFDPFFTTGSTRQGLGLAIVQRIVHSHGGEIRFATEPSRGTSFTILLPACAEAALQPTPARGAHAEQEPPKRDLILIAEDEGLLRAASSKILRMNSFSVLEAEDGNSAVSLMRDHFQSIGVILLDIRMPGASSAEIIAEARRLRPDIKVIVTSAYGQNEVDECFPGVAIDSFIRKPYRLGELVALVREVAARVSAAGAV
jgi:PAS domain S-box-containing protein